MITLVQLYLLAYASQLDCRSVATAGGWATCTRFPGHPGSGPSGMGEDMPAPTFTPDDRDPRVVAPADSYRPSDPVWVYRGNTWCAGVVERASALAVTVTYRPGTSRGTAVDTLTAAFVCPREDPDPILDRSRYGWNQRLPGDHAVRKAS